MKTFFSLRNLLLSLCLYCASSLSAFAVLTIDITQGVEGASPIAIVPFGWQGEGNVPQDMRQIITHDLARSGRFAPLPVENMPQRPSSVQQVDFPSWREVGSRHLVIGTLVQQGTQYKVTFQLFDVLRGEPLLSYSFSSQNNNLRRTAHRISDMIYKALSGEEGAFDSRIAFVTVAQNSQERKRIYRLQIADADGHGAQTMITSEEPIFSPAWSPDGRKLAYVSLENKRASVFVQDLASGRRDAVAQWQGLNTAPAWSPDGSRLALSLSKDGNSEIYLLNLLTRNLQRLTVNPAIDTEPAWSPDGRSLVFTSDRGGRPQIYRVASNGGTAQRVTFSGNYNARASYAPDGTRLVLINGSEQGFRIAVLDLRSGHLDILSQAGMDEDESPSFAPNGSLVVYASGTFLQVASVDGRVRQRIAVSGSAQIREPAWSPLNQ